MNVPVTFALDLPTHGAAVAQRKQLLLLPLLQQTRLCYITQRKSTSSCLQDARHLCTRNSTANRRPTHFVPRPYGEEDVWQKRLWSKGAIESDDASQEGPEDHQDVDIPGARLLHIVKTQRTNNQCLT